MTDIDRILSLAQLPSPWAATLGGLLGAVIGSYLATTFVRWPQGQSASQGRSRCDGCRRQLRWFEVIPVVSWLAVQGLCRSCRQPIEPSHTAVEIICAIAGAITFAQGLPLIAPILWLLTILAFFDAAYLWLPDRLVLPLAFLCLAAPAPHEDMTLPLRLSGGAIGFAALWFIGAAFRRKTGKVGLGGGDAKLFGAIGLWCGALQLPLVLLLACAIGFVDVARRLLRGDDRKEMRLPLGAYLAISTIWLAIFVPTFDKWTLSQPNGYPLVIAYSSYGAGA